MKHTPRKSVPVGGFGPSSFGSGSGSSLSYLSEPPSFTAVSDPNLVVSLKNILKKDGTTKAKGLEDLLVYAQAHPFDQEGGVEEALLEIWVQIYPRTSIDNSRRVRELSHNVQLELLKSARKRMEKHVPQIVGAWLSGPFDRDRVVARAASDGLSSFLNTLEKMNGFWSKCQSQILDYAVEGIRETADSLSDERSTTKEDAESKHFRVITASLSLVLGLLQRVDSAHIERASHRYEDFFSEEAVWGSITFSDSQVRKTVCQLLFACLDRKLPYTELKKVKQAFVTGGLKTSQLGSALEYARALTKLTQTYPDIWLASGTEKRSPLKRLQNFIAKGSQGSQPRYWTCLDQLLTVVPSAVVSDPEAASALLTALKSGVTNREEPRTNTAPAWDCYINTAKRLLSILPEEDKLLFAREQLFPLFEQFLFSTSEKPTAIPTGPNAILVLAEAYKAMAQSGAVVSKKSAEEWERLGSVFVSKIAASLPEVSKDFRLSQNRIAEEGRRWFAMAGQIRGLLDDSSLSGHTEQSSQRIIGQCISLLETRNLKPFGAARILEYALSTSSHLFAGSTGAQLSQFLLAAMEEDALKFIDSPSAPYLFSCLRLLGGISAYKEEATRVWDIWVDQVLKLPTGDAQESGMISLLSQDNVSALAQAKDQIQELVISETLRAAKADKATYGLLDASITYHALSNASYQRLIEVLAATLAAQGPHTESALDALQIVAQKQPEIITRNDELQTSLLASLLSFSEFSEAAVSSKAAAVRALLEAQGTGRAPLVGIVQSNLEKASFQSLEIDTLVKQARKASDSGVPLDQIFPSTSVWKRELRPFLEKQIDPSLSITTLLGSAISLVNGAQATMPASHIPRDRKGRSIPARMALFTAELLTSGFELNKMPHRFQVELFVLHYLTIQLISDQITTMEEQGIWKTLKLPEMISQAEDCVTKSKIFLNERVTLTKWWDSSVDDVSCQVLRAMAELLIEQARVLEPVGLYSAKVLYDILQAVTEAHGLPPQMEERFMKPEILKATRNTFLPATAIISGLGESLQASKLANHFLNKLISDAAGAERTDENTPIILVLLTASASIYGSGGLPAAKNRIVFASKQITSWLAESEQFSPPEVFRICQALQQLLPSMNDVYGSYWESTLEFCNFVWKNAASAPLKEVLPSIHASLKLARVLENLDDPNDDLQDVLKGFSGRKPAALIGLLKLPRDTSSHLMEAVDGILCREVEKIPAKLITDLEDIYGLVASDSREIQTAAYSLLHKAIPAKQEQESVDILLDKRDARLPDELSSLLLDAPTLDAYTDEMLAEFPVPIRCYLLSWCLVFDAYSTSFFKIRNDFTESLKTENSLEPLLNFIFDVLGHSAAHPLNLDKAGIHTEQIVEYDIKLASSEPEEKDMQWLLVFLFYRVLQYTPGLFKRWYVDCRSKQTKLSVESWTTKNFSPLIISGSLDEVQSWADNQEAPAADEKEFIVKVSRNAKEVTAGYEIDESQASIAIKIPPSYPIESVAVIGLQRVAVPEKKWQSWLMTTQGVITFSNGNIVDGLQVFKRNIVGAMKGQAECAICYSIISTDKRMPDKKCGTCKNLFHRSCLYKWFQTSNQNTCPLCRNPIEYLGADTQKRRGGGA